MKVLVVDDNAAIRESIETLMMIKGYPSVSAKNGIEALKMLKQHSDVDVVITDVLMPEMDGITLSRHIGAEFPRVKVIAISGGGSNVPAREKIQECRDAGIKQVLQKPFTLEELASALEAV